MPALSSTPILFGKFVVTAQVFHLTPLSFAVVNLKPLLPGHVLVSPRRPVARLADLSADEVADLFRTVQRVGRTVERVFHASALNVAVQDGAAAGQSVPHVHAHIVPRANGDMDAHGGNDCIYEWLEGGEGDVGLWLEERRRWREGLKFPKVDDEGRRPRTEEEMNAEAEMLRKEMEDAKL